MFNFAIFIIGPRYFIFPSKSLKIYHADYSIILTTFKKTVKCILCCSKAWRYFVSVLCSIIHLQNFSAPCFMRFCKDGRCFLMFHPGNSPSKKVVYIGNYEYRVSCLEEGNYPIITLFIMSFTRIFALKQNVME